MVDRRQFLGMLLVPAAFVEARAAQSIALLPPQLNDPAPLMQALKARRSTRAFAPRPLSAQVLSNLLWATLGVNRPDMGGRTAPSAHNRQEIEVYVALAEGAYLYDAKAHALSLVVPEDLRAQTGMQDFAGTAPVNLVYVADFGKMGTASRAEREFYAATDTGFVSQNAYLYCAAAGLATVVRGWVDRDALARSLKLRRDQRVILAQTVGYPSA
jgi:SagB-type dehydrogenase family enzyme